MALERLKPVLQQNSRLNLATQPAVYCESFFETLSI